MTPMKPEAYQIEKVSNGYIVRESVPFESHMTSRNLGVASKPPFVFETFGKAAAWLEEQFEGKTDDPKQAV